ncbi:GDSL esterase/lipase At4g28780-like [Pistacia vera]|uniref:GDSL esterase/lipase At4g28780-like n=1 Tax=Pistacia vera TaxID=55513 RepID=UPI0012639E44|nr:GDSL esterase/lipase At4g28780-like [Pistacia vera]
MITVFVLVIVMVIVAPQAEAARAFFVFGDSLVDSGNNNHLATTARADYPPYGIDFPTHTPTGRFSNGLNLPDVISESIGIAAPLPYLSPELTGQKLLTGANFASAGVGILNDTGLQFLNILRIHRQLELFGEYQERLSGIIGQGPAQELVSEALVLTTLGGNDFVNNYFLTPFAPRRRQYTLPQYCSYLIYEYRKFLLRLYGLGARRVIVTGIGQLGCVPAELALAGSVKGECAGEPQQAKAIYNPLLVQMLQELNTNVLGSNIFIASNAFDMNMDIINDPKRFGFKTSKVACCGQGPYNGLGTCNSFSFLCANRNTHVFWDAFHPSERAVRLIVKQMMTGSTKYMNPMNLSTIVALDST